ncbi:MAG TPA: cobyric acid synthase, partial [Firmicutes bacterium]|nr:cobyric acid synthase [Bacillota bacterium]
VLLVADIDRGGMLASVVGTLELLAPEERQRVAGIVVNKFRGDMDLLRPGLDFLSQRTGIPVVGVLPYLPGLFLDEEDSVSLEHRRQGQAGGGSAGSMACPDPAAGAVQLAVVHLPHISNFTDFAPLEAEPGVRVRYVNPGQPAGLAHAVILPGTKSTLADLRWLKQHGYQRELRGLLRSGVPILGICGGYQMLGQKLADPAGADGDPGEEEGLGLLDTVTMFLPEKQTHLVEAQVTEKAGFLKGLPGSIIRGYEIHTGVTVRLDSARPWLRIVRRGSQTVDIPEGAVAPTDLVYGTYLHDVFHNQAFRKAFLSWLRLRNGLPPEPHAPVEEPGEASPSSAPAPSSTPVYVSFSRTVRASLDMSFVYALIGSPHQ